MASTLDGFYWCTHTVVRHIMTYHLNFMKIDVFNLSSELMIVCQHRARVWRNCGTFSKPLWLTETLPALKKTTGALFLCVARFRSPSNERINAVHKVGKGRGKKEKKRRDWKKRKPEALARVEMHCGIRGGCREEMIASHISQWFRQLAGFLINLCCEAFPISTCNGRNWKCFLLQYDYTWST